MIAINVVTPLKPQVVEPDSHLVRTDETYVFVVISTQAVRLGVRLHCFLPLPV